MNIYDFYDLCTSREDVYSYSLMIENSKCQYDILRKSVEAISNEYSSIENFNEKFGLEGIKDILSTVLEKIKKILKEDRGIH